MPSAEAGQTLGQRFAGILTAAGAFLGDDVLTTFLQKTVDTPFIDIDRVWHRGGLVHELVDLLLDAFAEWGLDDLAQYETIVAASSTIASYGAIPIAGALAARLDRHLCILSQASNGEYSLYPSTLSYQDLLADKDVLLLHDAIVYGNSVARVAQLVRDMDARVRALVVLVDQDPAGRRLPEALRGVPEYALVTGQQLARLRVEK